MAGIIVSPAGPITPSRQASSAVAVVAATSSAMPALISDRGRGLRYRRAGARLPPAGPPHARPSLPGAGRRTHRAARARAGQSAGSQSCAGLRSPGTGSPQRLALGTPSSVRLVPIGASSITRLAESNKAPGWPNFAPCGSSLFPPSPGSADSRRRGDQCEAATRSRHHADEFDGACRPERELDMASALSLAGPLPRSPTTATAPWSSISAACPSWTPRA